MCAAIFFEVLYNSGNRQINSLYINNIYYHHYYYIIILPWVKINVLEIRIDIVKVKLLSQWDPPHI